MLKSFHKRSLVEAGCDEAGRGCFAGPVFAAAVILPKRFRHPLLNDSKQLKPCEREELKPIIEREAISYAVAMVDVDEIDTINILRASLKAMHLAIERLSIPPSFLLIDGNYFTPYKDISHRCFVKGDGTYASIAAASILAKTNRDAYMRELHNEFPHYCWLSNKGYGTVEHRDAIRLHGITKYHRKSFNILAAQETIFQNNTLPGGIEFDCTFSETGHHFEEPEC
ncbi:MAG TPA: ribonuclease HII [Chitinophagaceae bacterium]|nr:ribonuclease HII [Chitinophagaceae bacterium]